MIDLLSSLPGAVAQGLIWGIMAVGVYITYKLLDIAATAHSTASHRLRPLSSIMVQTAAPVQMEPSTVRSAMSSSL